MAEKTLYILRHAKTEPLAAGQEDHQRPLAERGVNEAKNLGKYLLAQHIRPQRVWCSSATRTRQTLQHLQASYGETLPTHYEDALYHMSLPEILRQLATVPQQTQSLLWVGHNPGLHEICMHLAGQDESELTRKLYNKFPPCSFAEFVFDGEWAAIDRSTPRFVRFITPGDL